MKLICYKKFFNKKKYTQSEIIRKLLQLTKHSASLGEVPIASVICESFEEQGTTKYKIISQAFNSNRFFYDPTAHSELLAIRRASIKKKKVV